jgi:WG containing repeat
MKLLICLLVSLFGYWQSIAETYNVFEVNGKIGLKDTEGHVLIPPSYDALGWSEGPFSVLNRVTGYKSGGRWGIIDVDNQAITKPEFSELLPAEGNLIIAYRHSDVSARHLAGCLDTSGKEMIPFQYDGLTITSQRAIVYVKSGNQFKYGLIDHHNRTIIPTEYSEIQFLGSVRYAVKNTSGQFALFSESGKALTGFIFDDISSFKNNFAIVYQNNYQGIIDRDGMLRVNPSFKSVELHDDGSARGRKQHQWIVLDGKNKILHEVQLDSIVALNNNLFGILTDDGYELVNDNFSLVCDGWFSSIAPFKNGKAIIGQGGKYGMINSHGKILIKPEYGAILLDDGHILGCLQSDHWVLLDSLGNRKTSKSYDAIERFNGTYFPVKNKQYFGAIDANGKEVISCVYDSILQYKEGKLVVKFHGEYGVIDQAENWIVPPSSHKQFLISSDRFLQQKESIRYLKSFDGEVIYFTDNPLKVNGDFLEETISTGATWRIDLDGRIVNRQMPPAEAFEKILSESEGLRGIKKDGRFGFVDDQGRLRIANRYEGIKPFQEGLAAIRILGKWGFLDHDEKLVIQPVHDEVTSFHNGVAVVMQKGLSGLINQKGEVILPIRYQSISMLPSKRFELQNEKMKGLADADGRLIFAPKYTDINDLDNGFVIVSRDGKCGLVTLEGLSTIPLIYDYILYDRYNERYLALKRSQWEIIP